MRRSILPIDTRHIAHSISSSIVYLTPKEKKNNDDDKSSNPIDNKTVTVNHLENSNPFNSAAQNKKQEDLIKLAKKTKFFRPSYNKQFCVLYCCCCKKSENVSLVESLNNYHKQILDDRTVIKLNNDMKLMKNLIFTSEQKKFFDILSIMKNSKDLTIYENDGVYEEKISSNLRDDNELLVKGIKQLNFTLDNEITDKMLSKFFKKITDHHETVKRKRSSLML